MLNTPKTQSLTPNRLVGLIAKGASLTFLLRLYYTFAAFLTTLILSRWLGPEDLGTYNYIVSWAILAAMLSKCGFEDFITRELATFRKKGDTQQQHNLVHIALRATLLFSCVLGTLAVACALATKNESLLPSVALGAVLVPALAVLGIYRGIFRGIGKIVLSQIPEYVFRPSIMIFTTAFLAYGVSQEKALWALGANAVATFSAVALCVRANSAQILETQNQPISISASPLRSNLSWIRSALPFLLIAGLSTINQRIDRLMLGSLLDMSSVGFYTVSAQIALLVVFPSVGISTAVSPLVAQTRGASRDELKQLELALSKNMAVCTIVSMLIVIVILTAGDQILQIFGPTFTSAWSALSILALGQLFNVAAGPAGLVLTMSGKENIVAMTMVSTIVINILLNTLLIPTWGLEGAAMATAISTILWNLMLMTFAAKLSGISTNFIMILLTTRRNK